MLHLIVLCSLDFHLGFNHSSLAIHTVILHLLFDFNLCVDPDRFAVHYILSDVLLEINFRFFLVPWLQGDVVELLLNLPDTFLDTFLHRANCLGDGKGNILDNLHSKPMVICYA